jgi:phenylpyruvate tautomerase PptA (4-oxalocrotonate tautomerase family)
MIHTAPINDKYHLWGALQKFKHIEQVAIQFQTNGKRKMYIIRAVTKSFSFILNEDPNFVRVFIADVKSTSWHQ